MTTVDLDGAIDGGRIVRLQLLVFALCVLALMLDGMDNQTLAVLGPNIAREWRLTPKALGLVFTSASITAAIFGGILGGALADRIGRRVIIVGATAFYGVMTVLTATARDVDQLMIWRAMSGIGFGAVLPNAAALLAEYWPARHRGKIVCIAFGGYALGAAFGGALAAWLTPDFGWRSVFVVGGVSPILLAGALYAWLPESVRFLALDPNNAARTRSIMAQLSPGSPSGEDVRYVTTARGHAGGSPGVLFRGGLGPLTCLVWLISSTSLLHLVFTVFWTPFIVHAAGMGFQAQVWTNVSMLVGGCLGPIVLGLTMDRFGQFATIAVAGCGSVLSLVSFALALGDPLKMALFAFALGFCVQGFQSGLVGVSAIIYPTQIRATGLGWSSGVGRLASIAAPIAGGYLVSAGLTPRDAYLSSALLPIISLGALLALWALVRHQHLNEADHELVRRKSGLAAGLE